MKSIPTNAEPLFAHWCDAAFARLGPDGTPSCPACPGFRHGRVVELVHPFVVRWRMTGEPRWLDAATKVVEWAERELLLPEGCYTNDPGDTWLGTTEFAQAAIARALLAGGDALPSPLRDRWTAILRRLSDWLRAWIDPPAFSVNVNYRAAHPLAMELAAQLLDDASYRSSGIAQARRVLSLFAPGDGLLIGESHPMERVSPRGFRGVDIGYNLEESLPALAAWAELAGDNAALDAILRCARAHLPFVLPDGAIDDSFGSRAYKWSYWGSRTSDGILPLLATLARHGDATATARIPAVLDLWERCTTGEGLLAGGLHYEAAGEPPCLHHTVCHLKALAECLGGGKGRISDFGGIPAARSTPPCPCGASPLSEGGVPPVLPPSERGGNSDALHSFASCGAHVANVGRWRATFSENDLHFHADGGESVGGGCLSLLWHRALGPLCAATMARFARPESNNVQAPITEPAPPCLTPRVETPDGTFLSVCSHDASVSVRTEGGVVIAEAEGFLRGLDGAEGPRFALRHRLSSVGLEIRARCDAPARLVLPIVALPDEAAAIAPDGRSATVSKRGGTLTLRAAAGDAPLATLPTTRPDGRSFNPVPGFLCVPFALAIAPGTEVSLSLSTP